MDDLLMMGVFLADYDVFIANFSLRDASCTVEILVELYGLLFLVSMVWLKDAHVRW